MADERDAFELEIVIAAPPAAVWEAIAERPHREAWWPYLELEPRAGGPLRERWHDGEGREQETRGEVLVADRARRLRASWRDDAWPAETEVELTMREEGEATRLRLRHSGWHRLPDGAPLRSAHREGWSLHLAGLKAYAERLAG